MTQKITKKINSNFNPTLMNSYQMYGFGSWLKENAGVVGAVAGTGLGALVGMPGVGMQLGSTLGGAVQQGTEQQQLAQQQAVDGHRQDLLNNLPQQQQYSMANGGLLNSYANGGNMDNITDRLTEFKNGGTHEQSPTGGIPVGNNALTEEGEFLFVNKDGKKYVFSNRF